jgi:hypothetical protein
MKKVENYILQIEEDKGGIEEIKNADNPEQRK